MGKTRKIGKVVEDTVRSKHPWKSGKGYWVKCDLHQYVVFPEDNIPDLEIGKTYKLSIFRTFFRNNYCIKEAVAAAGK